MPEIGHLGQGSWFLDTTHFAGPVTPFVREVFPGPVGRGFADGTRPYGLLLDRIEWAFIGPWPYLSPRPVRPLEAAGELTRGTWLGLVDSSPELQERLATSSAVFDRRSWREDLDLWDHEMKPASIRANEDIAAAALGGLGAHDVLRHLERCRANLRRAFYRHHRFNVAAVIAVGDYLVHGREWTGRRASELLGALRMADPVFVGGADIDAPGVEDMALLVGAAEGRDGRLPDGGTTATAGELAASLRDAVAPPTRPKFDDQLAEARATYRLRDERARFCDVWALGLAREAVLALGARLADAGTLEHPAHLIEAGYTEMRALAQGSADPTAGALAARAMQRGRASVSEIPLHLGPPPRTPVPAEWLPAGAARTERAFRAYMEAMEGEDPDPEDTAREDRGATPGVRGVGASPGRYEGRACVVEGHDGLARVAQGDVLVSASTTPAFNVVLPLLGAIVTDQGGLLSHTAIVARAYGIPAVVGTGDATKRLTDGVRVIVDGDVGEVSAST